MTFKSFLVAVPYALLAGGALADCSVDRAGYDALEFDMTYAQVAEIFGCEAEVSARADITGGKATVYEWVDAATGAKVATVFQGGELRSMMAPN